MESSSTICKASGQSWAVSTENGQRRACVFKKSPLNVSRSSSATLRMSFHQSLYQIGSVIARMDMISRKVVKLFRLGRKCTGPKVSVAMSVIRGGKNLKFCI